MHRAVVDWGRCVGVNSWFSVRMDINMCIYVCVYMDIHVYNLLSEPLGQITLQEQ